MTVKRLGFLPMVRVQGCICPNPGTWDSGMYSPGATTIARRLLSIVISAHRAAVAEGCQERTLALGDLEDSQQGHTIGSTQEPWPGRATSFRASISVSSSPVLSFCPCLF